MSEKWREEAKSVVSELAKLTKEGKVKFFEIYLKAQNDRVEAATIDKANLIHYREIDKYQRAMMDNAVNFHDGKMKGFQELHSAIRQELALLPGFPWANERIIVTIDNIVAAKLREMKEEQ